MTFDALPAGESVFVDANIFLYSFTAHPHFGAACQKLLDRIGWRAPGTRACVNPRWPSRRGTAGATAPPWTCVVGKRTCTCGEARPPRADMYARRTRESPESAGVAAVVINLASTVQLLRLLIIVGVVARTGRVVLNFHHGHYVPVSGDGMRLLLHGYSSLYAVEPVRSLR